MQAKGQLELIVSFFKLTLILVYNPTIEKISAFFKPNPSHGSPKLADGGPEVAS